MFSAKGTALTFMAGAIVSTSAIPVAGSKADWCKAAAAACTGLAALFLHPPGAVEAVSQPQDAHQGDHHV